MSNNSPETHISSSEINGKAKSVLKKLNKVVKNYKELGLTMCAIVGTVVTCYWNLLCEVYYNGYSVGLGIDIRFIEKDSQGLFISILIFLSSSLFLLPGIREMDKRLDKNMNSPLRALRSFFISLSLTFLTLVVIGFVLMLTKGVISVEILFLPFVILTLLSSSSVVYFIQFICLLFEFIVKKIKELKKVECNNSQQQNNDESNSTVTPPNISQPRNNWGKLILAALLISILFMPISYWFGWQQASQKEYFDFIVDEYNDEIGVNNSPGFNLILSQNSEYYCLSKYTISKDDGKEVIKIFPDYQTIVPKSDDESFIIIRKHFVNAGKESCVTFT